MDCQDKFLLKFQSLYTQKPSNFTEIKALTSPQPLREMNIKKKSKKITKHNERKKVRVSNNGIHSKNNSSSVAVKRK